MKILYMGDGKWGELSLLKLINSDEDIVGVVVRKNPSDSKCSKLANDNNLPLFQPNNVNSDVFFQKVKRLNPDLIISMSYDQLIKKRLITFPSKGIINAHAGMLPFYRGRSPINWAIINGEDYIGLTIHYIDEGIDTGDIIVQEKINISKKDDYNTILKKAENLAPKLLMQSIILIKNNLVLIKEHKHKEGIYLPKRNVGDEIINWKWNSDRIYNFIRALVPPGPCARTFLGGIEIKVLKSELIDAPNFIGHPGQVVGRDQSGVKVKTGDSIIKLEKVIY